MPRKNKGMWYEVHPTPVKGKDGKNLVYVRPQLSTHSSTWREGIWLRAIVLIHPSARLPPGCHWPGR